MRRVCGRRTLAAKPLMGHALEWSAEHLRPQPSVLRPPCSALDRLDVISEYPFVAADDGVAAPFAVHIGGGAGLGCKRRIVEADGVVIGANDLPGRNADAGV